MAVVERLVGAGFRPVAIAHYERALNFGEGRVRGDVGAGGGWWIALWCR